MSTVNACWMYIYMNLRSLHAQMLASGNAFLVIGKYINKCFIFINIYVLSDKTAAFCAPPSKVRF